MEICRSCARLPRCIRCRSPCSPPGGSGCDQVSSDSRQGFQTLAIRVSARGSPWRQLTRRQGWKLSDSRSPTSSRPYEMARAVRQTRSMVFYTGSGIPASQHPGPGQRSCCVPKLMTLTDRRARSGVSQYSDYAKATIQAACTQQPGRRETVRVLATIVTSAKARRRWSMPL